MTVSCQKYFKSYKHTIFFSHGLIKPQTRNLSVAIGTCNYVFNFQHRARPGKFFPTYNSTVVKTQMYRTRVYKIMRWNSWNSWKAFSARFSARAIIHETYKYPHSIYANGHIIKKPNLIWPHEAKHTLDEQLRVHFGCW